jgi:hypothetical protein
MLRDYRVDNLRRELLLKRSSQAIRDIRHGQSARGQTTMNASRGGLVMFSLSVVSDGYLLVIVSGKGSLARYRAVVGFIADLIESEHEHHVLVDMLSSEPSLTLDEHRQLGDEVAMQWRDAQVAVVVPSAERVLVGEQAAQAGGTNMRTFTNLHDAGEWLRVSAPLN